MTFGSEVKPKPCHSFSLHAIILCSSMKYQPGFFSLNLNDLTWLLCVKPFFSLPLVSVWRVLSLSRTFSFLPLLILLSRAGMKVKREKLFFSLIFAVLVIFLFCFLYFTFSFSPSVQYSVYFVKLTCSTRLIITLSSHSA